MTKEQVYNYLVNNYKGFAKGKKRCEISHELGISERQYRKITQEINSSMEFEKLISTSERSYVCDNKQECKIAIKDTFLKAISLFKKAQAMAKKVGLNDQLVFEDNEIKFVETF